MIPLFMKARQISYLLILCFIHLPLSWAWGTPVQEAVLVDRIIATVGDQPIMHAELEIACQQYMRQEAAAAPDLSSIKCKILSQLIHHKMLLVEADRTAISLTEEELAQVLANKLQHLLTQTGSVEKLRQLSGKSLEAIEDELRVNLREQLLVEKTQEFLTKDVAVTPQEVRAFFEAIPVHNRPYYPAEVVVRQIVKYPQADPKVQESLIAQLRLLKTRLQNGEDFAALAQAYSQDPSSARQGGDLGFRLLGTLEPTYEAATLALQPGEISEPVVTSMGLHVIQLLVRDKKQYRSRHILLRKPSPAMHDIEAAMMQLMRLRDAMLAGKISFEKAAMEVSEDAHTVYSGGLLLGASGCATMSIDDLPPDVYFAVEKLMPGEIAAPIQHTTAEGRIAVSLILLEEKSLPHQANLLQDYDKLQQLCMHEKRLLKLNTWLQQASTNIAVDIVPEYQHCVLHK